jgi:hypothetical protein
MVPYYMNNFISAAFWLIYTLDMSCYIIYGSNCKNFYEIICLNIVSEYFIYTLTYDFGVCVIQHFYEEEV